MNLPRKCAHCGGLVHHYGACGCRDGRLAAIDIERARLTQRIWDMDAMERELLKSTAPTGVVVADGPLRWLKLDGGSK